MLALLAGCASKPQVSARQESTRYLARASHSYTPPGPSSDPWGPYVREASAKYDVPERWIREVMRQESGGNMYGRGGELITSGAGAMGLMQVMPATYDDLRSRYRELGDDPYDPHNNVLAGAAYLREMYDIYGSPGFLAAYNAGPGRLDDYLTRNRTLPAETRRYVAAIGPRIAGHEPQRASPGEMYAMNAIPLDIQSGPRYPSLPATQFASAAPAAPARPIVLNPPVEVADAPAPMRLAPQPVVVADAAPAGPFIKLAPQPVVIAEAEPARPFIKLNPPAPEATPFRGEPVMRLAAIPEPPTPPPGARDVPFARRTPPAAGRPIEVAEMPEPPRVPSARYAAAAELSAPRGRTGFSLIPTANAAPVHKAMAGGNAGNWAVQVGAFANPNLAQSATSAAREHAREVLGGAHTVVAGVKQPGGTLYRARLGGLSRDAAAQACEKLSRARTNCMVVSPDALR